MNIKFGVISTSILFIVFFSYVYVSGKPSEEELCLLKLAEKICEENNSSKYYGSFARFGNWAKYPIKNRQEEFVVCLYPNPNYSKPKYENRKDEILSRIKTEFSIPNKTSVNKEIKKDFPISNSIKEECYLNGG